MSDPMPDTTRLAEIAANESAILNGESPPSVGELLSQRHWLLRRLALAEELAGALKPFTFKATPDEFLGTDGEVTHALIDHESVQVARAALRRWEEESGNP